MSHSNVAEFHTFTLNLAPKLASVVLNQTLPVGRVYVSDVLNSGIDVCGETCKAGG